MEGCPKPVMISFDTKETSVAEFDDLRKYIRDYYQESGDSYKEEIQQLNKLRKGVINVTRDNQGCIALRRYYAQLQFLQSRFPMGEGGAAALPFTWYDVYNGDPIVQKDIRYEQACVLFNLGGLYSQLGANESRSNEERMKTACTYFQCAAGIFQYLLDNFSLDSYCDMSRDIMQLKLSIMLGQAQECLLEKSILDNRKNALIARISVQVSSYYDDALKLLESSSTAEMGSTLRKSWAKHLKIKKCMFTALGNVYMSNQSEAEEKFGEQVAFLKVASERVTDAGQLSKNQPNEVIEPLKFIADVVGNKYNAAVKDNDFVYHAAVPATDRLPSIIGVSLVKAMPFVYDDKDVYIADIFQRLVPMRAHETSSLYSEEKSQLLRTVTKEIEHKDIELSENLTSMQVEDLIDPKMESLPESLLAIHNTLATDTSQIDEVVSGADNLQKLSKVLESNLAELTLALQEEEQMEVTVKANGYQTAVGEISTFRKDLERCQESHLKANKTNMELVKHIDDNKEIIKLLSGPMESLFASLPSENVIDAPIDEPVVQRIREILGKVDKMKTQRKELHQQLRDQISKDDITNLIVIKEDGNMENFFKEQLQKHDELCSIIRQNLTAQDNVLRALLETNAKYATTRKAAKELQMRRDEKIAQYTAAYEMFKTIRERLRHGRDFYSHLQESIVILQSSVSEFKKRRHSNRGAPTRPTKRDGGMATGIPQRPSAPKPAFSRSSSTTDQPSLPRSRTHSNEMKPSVVIPAAQNQADSLPGQPGDPRLAVTPPTGMALGSTGLTDPTGASAFTFVDRGIPQMPLVPSLHSTSHPGVLPAASSLGTLEPQNPQMMRSSSAMNSGAIDMTASGMVPQNMVVNIPPQQNIGPVASHTHFTPRQPHPPAMPNRTQSQLGQHQPGMQPHHDMSQRLPQPLALQPRTTTPTQQRFGHPHQEVTDARPQIGHTPGAPRFDGAPGQPPVSNFMPAHQNRPHLPNPLQPEKVPGGSPMMPLQQQQQFRPHQQAMMGQRPLHQMNQPMQTPYGGMVPSQYHNQMNSSQHRPAMIPQGGQQLQRPPMQQLPMRPQQTQIPRQVGPVQPPLMTQQPPLMPQPISGAPPRTHQPGFFAPRGQPIGRIPFDNSLVRPPNTNPIQPQQPLRHVGPMDGMQQSNPTLPPPLIPDSVNPTNKQMAYPMNQSTGMGILPQSQPMMQPRMPAPYDQQRNFAIQQPGLSRQLSDGSQALPCSSLSQQQLFSPQTQIPASSNMPSHPLRNYSGNVGDTASPIRGALRPDAGPVAPSPFSGVSDTSMAPNGSQQTHPSYKGERGPPPVCMASRFAIPPATLSNQPTNSPYAQTEPTPKSPNNHQSSYSANMGGGAVMASGRPLMSAMAGGPTPLAGNTVVAPVSKPNTPDAAATNDSFAFQQFQMQQFLLQQQQLMALMQTQRHTEDALHIEQLQRQLQQQQLLIEKISRDQDRISSNQNEEIVMNAKLLDEIRHQKLTLAEHAAIVSEQSASAPVIPHTTVASSPTSVTTFPSNESHSPRTEIPADYPGNSSVTISTSMESSHEPITSHQNSVFVQRDVGTAPFYEPMLDKLSNSTDSHSVSTHDDSTSNLVDCSSKTDLDPSEVRPQQSELETSTISPLVETDEVKTAPMNSEPVHNNDSKPTVHVDNDVHDSSKCKATDVVESPSSNECEVNTVDVTSPSINEDPNEATPLSDSAQSVATNEPATTQGSTESSADVNIGHSPPIIESKETPSTASTTTVPNADNKLIRERSELVSGKRPVRKTPSPTDMPPEDKNVPTNPNVPDVVVARPSEGDSDDDDDRPTLLRQFGHLSERQGTMDEKLAWKLYIGELDAAVNAMHQQCMALCKTNPRTNMDGFTQIWNDLGQIERLDATGFTASAGKLNVSKNRYRDILPWDHSRVILKSSSQDYINANYVEHLTSLSPYYIATQGPIPQCFIDFWCMVWERDVSVIVMLTNEVEGTKLKCHPYWPRRINQPMAYGPIVVSLRGEEVQTDWKDRTMLITNTKTSESRIIKHMQFTSWPDYGTPDSPFDILSFMEEVYRYHEQESSSPLLLHCSAGVGRTGTFACIYSAIREINGGNGLIKIPGTVRKLRQCRAHMVQRKEQLIFCYQAILCHAQQFVAAEQEKLTDNQSPAEEQEEVFDDVISASDNDSVASDTDAPSNVEEGAGVVTEANNDEPLHGDDKQDEIVDDQECPPVAVATNDGDSTLTDTAPPIDDQSTDNSTVEGKAGDDDVVVESRANDHGSSDAVLQVETNIVVTQIVAPKTSAQGSTDGAADTAGKQEMEPSNSDSEITKPNSATQKDDMKTDANGNAPHPTDSKTNHEALKENHDSEIVKSTDEQADNSSDQTAKEPNLLEIEDNSDAKNECEILKSTEEQSDNSSNEAKESNILEIEDDSDATNECVRSGTELTSDTSIAPAAENPQSDDASSKTPTH